MNDTKGKKQIRYKIRELILQNQKKIGVILLVNMFIFWLLTIATTHIHSFPPDAFYYAKQLPVYYWIGMVLSFIIFIFLFYIRLQQKSKKDELIQIIFILILILYLFGLPSFIYDNVKFRDIIGVINTVNQLTMAHHTELTGKMGYLTSYPGAIFLFSTVHIISGIPIMTIANYYPIYLMFLLSILIYSIAKKISRDYAFLAPVGLLSLAWVQEYHFAPQSAALVLYIAFWVILYARLKNRHNQIAFSIANIMLLAAIIISHPGTPLFILANLYLLFFVSSLLLYLRGIKIEIALSTLLIPTLLFISWMLYIANGQFDSAVILVKGSVNNAISGSGPIINYELPNPQSDQLLINWIRKILTIIETAIGTVCVVYLWMIKKEKQAVILGSWFISCYFFHLVGMFHGGAFFGRILVFVIFPFSALITLTLSEGFKPTKSNINRNIGKILQICIISLIVSSAFLIPLTRYGGDYFEFMPDSDFATRKYASHFDIHPCGPNVYNASEITGPVVMFQKHYYNYFQVKQQKGQEYIDTFNSVELSKIYDSGESKIYKGGK